MMLKKKYAWILGATLLLCSQALMAGGSSRRHHPYGMGRMADMAAALASFRTLGDDSRGRPAPSRETRSATTSTTSTATAPMDVVRNHDSDDSASTSTSPLDIDSDEYPPTCTSSDSNEEADEHSDEMCVSDASGDVSSDEEEEGDRFWLQGLSPEMLLHVLKFVEGTDYLSLLQTSTYFRDILRSELDRTVEKTVFRQARSERAEDRIAAIHQIAQWLTNKQAPLSRRIRNNIMGYLIGEAFLVNDPDSRVRAEIPHLLESIWIHARTTDQEHGFFIDALAQLSNREMNQDFLETLPGVITHLWTEGNPNEEERGRLLSLIGNLAQAEWASNEDSLMKEALVAAIRTIALQGNTTVGENESIVAIIFMNLTDHGVRHTIYQTHPQLYGDIIEHRRAETRTAAQPPVRRRLFEE